MERMFARSKNKHHKIGDVHLFPTHYYLNGLTKESKYGTMSIEHSTFNKELRNFLNINFTPITAEDVSNSFRSFA